MREWKRKFGRVESREDEEREMGNQKRPSFKCSKIEVAADLAAVGWFRGSDSFGKQRD